MLILMIHSFHRRKTRLKGSVLSNDLLLRQLGFYNLLINAAVCKQLTMRAACPPPRPHREHNNRSKRQNRAHALGHDNQIGTVKILADGGSQARVRAGNPGRKAIVKNIKLRRTDERPANRKALLLPAGQVGAALRHHIVKPIGQLLNKERACAISSVSISSWVASSLP